MKEFNQLAFDRKWDKDGYKAAVMAMVPLEDDRQLANVTNAGDDYQCSDCGRSPYVRTYGPYRKRRTFAMWLRGKAPHVIPVSVEYVNLCECWRPKSLSFR